MKIPKISLTVMIAVVAVAAADLAWFRWFVLDRRSAFGFVPIGLDLGVVPMASVLIVAGAHVASRRGRVGAFARGFGLMGVAMLFAYGLLCGIAPALVDRAARRLFELTAGPSAIGAMEPILRRYLPPITLSYSEILWVAALLSSPQLLMAVAVGVRFRVRSERSRRETTLSQVQPSIQSEDA